MTLYDDPHAQIHESLPLMNVWGPKQVHSLAVVTSDWKYVYWPYADGDFEATEELYHLTSDRLELHNAAADTNQSQSLQRMRTLYDAAVAHWKKHAVSYHGYVPFGTVFDRHIGWDDKKSLVK